MSLRKGNTIISGLGSDGYSPIATVSKSGNTSTITVTDKNGTTSTQVFDGGNPEIITNSDSTYTITNLTTHKSYKLAELTSLIISAVETFDIESVIYFTSGSTPTSVSVPDTLTNIGDVPTLTTSDGVSTGTCEVNKSYIISVLNNIAVWRNY